MLGIFKINLQGWTFSFLATSTEPGLDYVCYKASSFKVFCFSFHPEVKSLWFKNGQRFALRNTAVHCGRRGCVWIFSGVCEHYSLALCEIKEWREIDSSAFFLVSHCLISILSPAVRKTNYVFNPLLHPPSPFIQIITLGNHNEFVADHFGLGEREGRKKKITESICLRSNRPLAITDNLLTLESCRLKFFQGLTKTYV